MKSMPKHTAAVLTISDRCFAGTAEDASGPALERLLYEHGFLLVDRAIVPDVAEAIADAIRALAEEAALVVTTGGTGLAARDVTPEATVSACHRLVPGLSERMRREGETQTPLAVLSRGVCGVVKAVRGETLVVNVPGSPRGAVQSVESVLPVLPHALDLLAGNTGHSAAASSAADDASHAKPIESEDA